VELAEASRLDLDERRRNAVRGLEVRRIDDAQRSTGGAMGLLREHAVAEPGRGRPKVLRPRWSGDARPALEHVRPLTLLVKVELAHGSGFEPRVDARDLGGDRQLAYSRLSSPPPLFEPHSTVG
jgi:hypothetical protein